MKHVSSARSWGLVVALGAGACFSDKGASTSAATVAATVAATSDDRTTTDAVPTTGTGGGTSSGTTGGGTSSGTTGEGTTLGMTGGGTTSATGGADMTTGSSSTGGTPGDPEIEMRCNYYIERSFEANAIFCGCLVEAGEYPDQATCMAAAIQPKAFWDCWCSIQAKYPETSAIFDCNIAVVEAYVPCVDAAACDQEAMDACASGITCMESQAASAEAQVKCADKLP